MKIIISLILIFLINKTYSQKDYVIKNLDIENITDFKEYEIFDSILIGKNIIFLGESGHGGQEFNQVKYKLIKLLHQKYGYDVILFESGIAECFNANSNKINQNTNWFMKNSIYPIWYSEPTYNLMKYIKTNNIDIAGVDYQRSVLNNNVSSNFILNLEIKDTSLLPIIFKLDSTFFNQIYKPVFHEGFNKIIDDDIKNKIDSLTFLYEKIINEFDEIYNVKNTQQNSYIIQIIKNKLFHLKYIKNEEKLLELRDSVMASNIMWYYDHFYKGRKIIVWGANDHFSKKVSTFNKNYYAGSMLPFRIKKAGYFIGIYAYSGKMFDVKRNLSYEISKPPKKSLENKSFEYFNNNNDVFLDLSYPKTSRKLNWKNKEVSSFVWGTIPVKITPNLNYDGIILINKLSITK